MDLYNLFIYLVSYSLKLLSEFLRRLLDFPARETTSPPGVGAPLFPPPVAPPLAWRCSSSTVSRSNSSLSRIVIVYVFTFSPP